MRVYTCTPIDFGGGPDFFARDSGLLCRGFQRIGIESRVVMPGQARDEDELDVIRTDYANLESADWWRGLELDGMVLYAWGRPRFRRVARALRDAGVFLVLNQDNGGLVSPRAGFGDWLREQWILGGRGMDVVALAKTAGLIASGLSKGLVLTDPLRAEHLSYGNVVSCVSPRAAMHYRRLCQTYGDGLADRIKVIPHPVECEFRWNGEEKRKQIVCVGRWSDERQKRARMMALVLSQVLAIREDLSVVIAGTETEFLNVWHSSLPPAAKSRVELAGKLDRGGLRALFVRSMVFYSPSAFESFGIAAAEALCCGCSVVAAESVSMASFEWFVTDDSGKLATKDCPEGHVDALQAELSEWERGSRDPRRISAIWGSRLHADQVAHMVKLLVEEQEFEPNRTGFAFPQD